MATATPLVPGEVPSLLSRLSDLRTIPAQPPHVVLKMTPVLPKGPGVQAYLDGDSVLSVASGGAAGGWQIVDRPRQRAIVQWFDTPPLQLSFNIILENRQHGVEPACDRIVSWIYQVPGTLQPPVLRIAGPVAKTAQLLAWVLDNFKEGPAIRDETGRRTQQKYSLTFYEYTPATQSLLQHLTPAQSARLQSTSSSSTATRQEYTVRSGDTLQRIAAQVLGDYTLAPKIAALNGIRDPASIQVGQRLVLP